MLLEKSSRTLLSVEFVLLFAIGCAPSATLTPIPPAATSTRISPSAAPTPSRTATPAPTQTPNPFPNPTLKVVGKEEIVFDWSINRCEDMDIPDLPARAFRDAQGRVQVIASNDRNRRRIGPDLNHLTHECLVVMNSDHNADPAKYDDVEWIAAPYTEDGTNVYATVHNEYQGQAHPGQCPQKDYFPCWYNALTLAVSTDGGETYKHPATPPGHLVATVPFRYEAGAGPYGIFSPSNIVKGKDGYYYEFIKVGEYRTLGQSVCLMRTRNLADPTSWRFWNGGNFEGRFANPYTDQIKNPADYVCQPIDKDAIGAQLVESITYNTYMDRYVLVGISADRLAGREVWGFYYAFSEDLIHWTHRKLLVEMALPWTVKNNTDVSYLYPALLDPQSQSRNFETTGKTAYLYYTRNNFGQGSLDRDLIRVAVEFFPSE